MNKKILWGMIAVCTANNARLICDMDMNDLGILDYGILASTAGLLIVAAALISKALRGNAGRAK